MAFQFSEIDTTWTLFLDRDGVINEEKNEDYIRNWNEFTFYKESILALPILANIFPTILITTNQKGVGKGLMTESDLKDIHSKMMAQLHPLGGRIDHIYYCTDLDNNSPNRKPQSGMALQAKEHFPKINFAKSIMIGNRMSDMQFGRNAGMHTIFLATTHPETPYPDTHIDYRFDNLLAFAKALSPA